MTRFNTPWSFAPFLFSMLLAACGSDSEDAADETKNAQAGGGQGGGKGGGVTMCPEPNESIDPTAVIDDLEDGNSAILPVSGRSGGWWTDGDDTPGGTLVPEPADVSGLDAPPEAIPGGRCGSEFAMRMTGQGFDTWGAVLGLSLAYGTRPNGEEGTVPYDASDWSGVEFWARVGDTSINQVRFALGDVNTEPDGGVCVEGGGSGKDCYDTFGVYLTQLDTTWRNYRIPFAGLSQRSFGYPADAPATDQLYTMIFQFDAGAIFDLWVDDLAFY